MSKALGITGTPVKGGFNLLLGLVVSTLISAAGLILILRLLSPSDYGLFAIALAAPNLIILFRDWGMDSAMVKYSAQFSSENKPEDAKSVLAAGLLFELILGGALFFIAFLVSSFLATDIFHRPVMVPLIEAASFIILGDALITAAQSAFAGHQKMKLYSVVLICQSSLKTVLALALVFLGFGAFGAILGNAAAFLVTGLIGFVIVYSLIYRKLPKQSDGKLEIAKHVKMMFKYGLPLSISTILSGFLTQFYVVIIAIYCDNFAIGNFQAAVNFEAYLLFFTAPISTLMLPTFAGLNLERDREKLKSVFRLSVKYAALLCTPVAVATMVMAKPLVSMMFGQKFSQAPLFLALYALNYLYPAFGSLSIGSFLNSQGRTKVFMGLSLITSFIGLPLILLSVPRFGVLGLILTTLAAGIPSLCIGIWWVKKHYSISIDWLASAKILLSSSATALVTYLIMALIVLQKCGSPEIQNWTQHIVGGAFFISAYIALVYLMKVVKKSDIDNLKEIIGPASVLFNVPFKITEEKKKD